MSNQHWITEENHGFLNGRSCVTASLEILQELAEGIEEGQIPTLLGCDISSAFDCLQRSKLLTQMEHLGCSKGVIKLFTSYFSLRTQQVEIGGKKSEKRQVYIGVLQGSALSPLLFLLYFLRGNYAIRACKQCKEEFKEIPEERTPRCSRCGTSVSYADDLNTIHRSRGKGRETIQSKAEHQG